MGWATRHIEELRAGRAVSFRPKGGSMEGKISSGQLCHVAPLEKPPVKGDVVLCKVRGNHYLHLVSGVRGDQYQISNNRGHVNGWVGLSSIFGLLTGVEA